IRALDADSRVESVQSIRRFKLLSYNDPYFSLQNTVNGDRIEHIHEITTGKNVVVGLIDTGVDRRHPELADSIVYTNNFVAHDQVSFDLDEHGTAVAGVIGSAANNDLGIVGVAPDIRLMVFKACHQEPASRRTSCDSVSIIKALNDVLQQQPDILNLSLSGPRDEIIEKLLKSASSSGMVLVAAVDETQPFDRSFPASMEEVIAVGTSFRQDLTGEMVLAPGTDMLTTAPGATYGFKSGSSMATAYVSGIAALMKEKVPDLTSAQIYDYLLQSARLDENELPVVDMCSAVNQAANTAYRNCERVRSMAAHIENPTDQSSTGGLAN
ncbi:MAG: S8 family serine peptidase, partial [Gammaproteobacteria bacterium]|nr:S8 family serine peptidase [Gammaproteobacteria bacterium]